MNEFSVKSFSKFLLCRFAYGKHLSCEMECLAGHLMVEVHLDGIFAYFQNHTRNDSSHAVHHRNCVSWHEEILAYFSVDLECRFRKVNDPVRVDFAISVSR